MTEEERWMQAYDDTRRIGDKRWLELAHEERARFRSFAEHVSDAAEKRGYAARRVEETMRLFKGESDWVAGKAESLNGLRDP